MPGRRRTKVSVVREEKRPLKRKELALRVQRDLEKNPFSAAMALVRLGSMAKALELARSLDDKGQKEKADKVRASVRELEEQRDKEFSKIREKLSKLKGVRREKFLSELLKKAGSLDSPKAKRIAEVLEDAREKEAKGLLLEAAQDFEQAGLFPEAAKAYEKKGEKIYSIARELGTPKPVSNPYFAKTAQLYEKTGLLNDAIISYKKAGLTEKATELEKKKKKKKTAKKPEKKRKAKQEKR